MLMVRMGFRGGCGVGVIEVDVRTIMEVVVVMIMLVMMLEKSMVMMMEVGGD